MREAAGTSVKSSLSHTFKYDTRDDKLAATRGVYAKTYQELAGLALGGDARFYKAEAEGQVSRMLGRSGVVGPPRPSFVSVIDGHIFMTVNLIRCENGLHVGTRRR